MKQFCLLGSSSGPSCKCDSEPHRSARPAERHLGATSSEVQGRQHDIPGHLRSGRESPGAGMALLWSFY